MIGLPVWVEMLLGALLGFGGVGMALRARPGPNQKFLLIGGAVLAVIGAALLLLNFF